LEHLGATWISRAKWRAKHILAWQKWYSKNGRNLYETMENHSGHLFSYCILRFNSPGWGNFGSVPTTGNWVWINARSSSRTVQRWSSKSK
jgi:hypothetical protein